MVARWATKKYVKHCVRLIGLIRVLIRGCNNPNVSITKSRATPLPYMTGCSEVAKTKKHPGLISVNSRWNVTQLSWTHQYVMECHKGLQHSSILCLEEWKLAPSMKTRAHKIPISKRFFQETILQAQIDSSVDFVKEVLNNTPRFFRFFRFRLPKNGNWIDYLGYHKVSTWNAPLKTNKRYHKMTWDTIKTLRRHQTWRFGKSNLFQVRNNLGIYKFLIDG